MKINQLDNKNNLINLLDFKNLDKIIKNPCKKSLIHNKIEKRLKFQNRKYLMIQIKIKIKIKRKAMKETNQVISLVDLTHPR